jgi:hypothetical protein
VTPELADERQLRVVRIVPRMTAETVDDIGTRMEHDRTCAYQGAVIHIGRTCGETASVMSLRE